MTVLAVDPGRAKCGVAVLDSSRSIKARCVVTRDDVTSIVKDLMDRFHPTHIIVGEGTGGEQVMKDLRTVCPDAGIQLVDEKYTSLEARRRYFQENPPKGILRLIPRGLLLPSVEVDDYVAVILAERFLTAAGSGTWPGH